MTIDHISPQNPTGSRDVSIDAMRSIGNLILLPEKLNGKLANKSFDSKKALLKKQRVPMDSVLSDASEWSDEKIANRTREIARLCHEEVFKI